MTTTRSPHCSDLPNAPVDDGLVLTCDADRLYPWGGFCGGEALFERLRLRPSPRTEILAEVFPPWRIRRPAPLFLEGGDPELRASLGRRFDDLDATHPVGPATLLCESHDVYLAGGTLYFVDDDAPRVFHESFRPQERWMLSGPGEDFARADETFGGDERLLFLDSVGSFNYGHFLVDDLPRLEALDHLPEAGPPVTILMVAYNVLIDEARRHAVSVMLGNRRQVRVRFLDRSRRYRFARLLHVTPSSEQPILKSPDALELLATRMRVGMRGPRAEAFARRLAAGRWRAPKLFIDRNPVRERELLNRDAVLTLMRERGFEVFDPETTRIGHQVVRFAQARLVVGITGAAMTNTVFCARGTPVLHLTPDGWDDPFYWDLAAVRGQPYAALSGPRETTAAREHLRPFRVDLDALGAAVSRIEAAG